MKHFFNGLFGFRILCVGFKFGKKNAKIQKFYRKCICLKANSHVYSLVYTEKIPWKATLQVYLFSSIMDMGKITFIYGILLIRTRYPATRTSWLQIIPWFISLSHLYCSLPFNLLKIIWYSIIFLTSVKKFSSFAQSIVTCLNLWILILPWQLRSRSLFY